MWVCEQNFNSSSWCYLISPWGGWSCVEGTSLTWALKERGFLDPVVSVTAVARLSDQTDKGLCLTKAHEFSRTMHFPEAYLSLRGETKFTFQKYLSSLMERNSHHFWCRDRSIPHLVSKVLQGAQCMWWRDWVSYHQGVGEREITHALSCSRRTVAWCSVLFPFVFFAENFSLSEILNSSFLPS